MSASKIHAQLLSTLSELAHVEKRAVLIFAEILEGRLFRELGYNSLFDYCIRHLKYSASAAGRRNTSQAGRMVP